ncbi:MAG: uracil-DNA glycosylase [Halobacteriovoraceae bacterium]|nr:uracil-DNA glycosylase [Halobacteriovoraceae bacterium]MCB9093901.1 uracil-DNA glycosylase [Halobacteriovoraceae bacterium]
MEKELDKKQILHCRNCQYYHISWDISLPHGCKLFNIKSKTLPMNIVKSSSGKDCQGFKAKTKK